MSPQDAVSATMLAAVGALDPTNLSRVEEVMEALSALKVAIVKPNQQEDLLAVSRSGWLASER